MSESKIADIDAGPLSLEASLYTAVQHGLKLNPNGLAVISTDQPSNHLHTLRTKNARLDHDEEHSKCLRWTYADMQSAALKVAIGLQKQGIQPNSMIVTLIPNCVEWAVIHWTSMLGKHTHSPLDPGALKLPRAVELQALLTSLEADILFVPDAAGATAIDRVVPSLHKNPLVKVILDSTAPIPTGWIGLLELASYQQDEAAETSIMAEALHDNLDRTCMILFTSGTTTGKPKGCPKSVRSMIHTTLTRYWGSSADSNCRKAFITQNFRAVATIMTIGS